MPEQTTAEMIGLLREIRDLLLPVADAYQDEYVRRQAERQAERIAAVRDVLSTPKRVEAWTLADGSRSQIQIAKQVKMDTGATSRFFKSLRDLGALTDNPNPEKAMEVQLG